ncbi:hypothetical protein B0H63DRAFT_473444 [Podospora didyma]|uniref:Cell surface protein n=1 Tax=Podospora didyma TaxID=330526 RepID=A0AAE0NQI3_9PEZI|nr:hypothetical protein B0H63DRAFT_473444 [Podospora didyma]
MATYPNQERGVRHHNAPVHHNAAGAANHGPTTFGESPASGPAPTTAGHHRHDVLNKLDPRIDSTHDRQPMANNVPEGTYGPHRSRIANALDPRVDSDMDGRGTTGTGTNAGPAMHGAIGSGRTAAPGGAYNTNTATTGGGVREGTYGPHNSRIANALDPRVDSDMDGRGTTGTTGAGYGGAGTGAGLGHQQHQHQQQSAAAAAAGYGGSGVGAQQQPRGGPAVMSGPGPAPNTAGPHRSDLLNKLDPRVDSKAGTAATSGVAAPAGAYEGSAAQQRLY